MNTVAPETAKGTVNQIPPGSHTITPHLICARATEAIDFYKKAFGATELSRLLSPDGNLMHARLQIGDSVFMLNDEMPQWNCLGPKTLKGSPVTIHLYVENVDQFVDHAISAGAKITMPLEDMFWGDRYAKLEDPFGHQWSVATHVRDVTEEEMKSAMEQMSC